jgi:putative ABC transport system permease protein
VALLPVATVAPLLALPAARDLSPRLFLPLAGFLMGNGLGGVVAFVNRFAEQLRERRGEVEARLSLGAPPRQAAEDLFRDAGQAALGPTLQAMALVGLTHAPALFTGGVAAGMHPLRAALFQFLVLQMTGLGTLLAALAGARLSWSRFFTRDLQVREGAGL